MKYKLRLIFVTFAIILPTCLGGCLGVVTPTVQEFWGDADDASKKVQAVVGQVRCELAKSIYNLRHTKGDKDRPELDFLDKWGVQIILVLSIDEKSALSPGFSIISPMPTAITTFGPGNTVTTPQSFTGSAGGVFSNEAINVDRTTLFYLVSDLNNRQFANLSCIPEQTNATLFIQSDLGIYDWLLRNFNLDEFQNADLAQGHVDNVLSHDIKFEIVSSGNATPTWKLVRFTGNTTSPLFMASRDRFQELIITMGRYDKVGGGLSPAASASSLAAQVGSALLSTSSRN